jgi:hypothetical protein
MKNRIAFIALMLTLPAGYSFAKGGKRADFSGKWALDMNKTQDIPSQLQSYTMSVTQTSRQISVDSKVEGNFRRERQPGGGQEGGGYPGGPRRGGGYPGGGYPGGRFPGGGYPGGGYPGGGYPGGGYPGGRFPGGRRGGGYPGGPGGRGEQMRKSMAFSMVAPSATYNLDGSSSTMQVDKPIPGSETLKAAWKKSGKRMDLSRVEDLRGGERTIKVQEQWTLSKDGKVLELQRTVTTPRGSTKIKMIFNKEESSSGRS